MSVIETGIAEIPIERSESRAQAVPIYRVVLSHAARIARANWEMSKLLFLHRPRTSVVRAVVVLSLVVTPFIMSWASGQVIAEVVAGRAVTLDDSSALLLALALIVAGALPLVIAVLDRLIDNWAFAHVQQAQVVKVPDLDPVTYSDPRLKDKIQQVQQRAVWRIMAFVKAQVMLLRALALAAIAAGMLWGFDPWLCLLVVAAMLPSMALEGVHAYHQFQIDERQGEWWRRFWENRAHILGSKTLAYLQVFGAAHWFANRFARQIGEAIEEYDVIERRSIGRRVLSMAFGMGALVCVALALVQGVVAGELTVAQFVFLLGALSLLGASLAEIASAIGQQLGQSLYVESFQEVLALESRTHFPVQGTVPAVTEAGMALELRDVRFGYPLGAGKVLREVIKGVSFAVPPGEKWAIVGVNGAGKSTLKALMVRLFDPDSGSVLLGGVCARRLDKVTLRKLVGCLQQEIQHYNLSVEEFIALGRTDEPIDRARVEWAAKRSGAAEFVERYPRRYQQRLGRDYRESEEPSGGQLQKLALASLLYMRAPLMVLDEPTAAIDPESAGEFWDTLFHETPGQTVIFSTHYLGAVRRADRIVVLDDGQVMAQGRHEQLMGTCPAYRRLFECQARDYRG